jgi:putative membrane protein
VIAAATSMIPIADVWGMHDGDIGTGWMIVMMLGMVLFWGLIILGAVWILREALGRGGSAGDPLAILDRRLAAGEITVSEYEERKKRLVGFASGA